jgi:hypothetical protein
MLFYYRLLLDTMTILIMTLLITTLLIMKILLTLNTGDITYNDINNNLFLPYNSNLKTHGMSHLLML